MVLSGLTLTLWTLKCLAELYFVYTCATRRVKIIWLLGTYSFPTTLVLMLAVQYKWGVYFKLDEYINKVGSLVMLYVFINLFFILFWEKRKQYIPIFTTTCYLILSQILLSNLNSAFGYNLWLGRMAIIIWMFAILHLSKHCRSFPRSMRSNSVDLMSSTIIPPHHSMLIAHDNKGC